MVSILDYYWSLHTRHACVVGRMSESLCWSLQRETAPDGGLEWPDEAMSPANIGIMLVRANANAFAKVGALTSAS